MAASGSQTKNVAYASRQGQVTLAIGDENNICIFSCDAEKFKAGQFKLADKDLAGQFSTIKSAVSQQICQVNGSVSTQGLMPEAVALISSQQTTEITEGQNPQADGIINDLKVRATNSRCPFDPNAAPILASNDAASVGASQPPASMAKEWICSSACYRDQIATYVEVATRSTVSREDAFQKLWEACLDQYTERELHNRLAGLGDPAAVPTPQSKNYRTYREMILAQKPDGYLYTTSSYWTQTQSRELTVCK
jgi:hypothetical protein